MTILLGLAASTLLSEDAACIAAALLIRQGTIAPAEGVAACAAGIYVGDAMLWVAGRMTGAWGGDWLFRGRRLATLPDNVDSAAAILASRFIPGTRLPLHLAAGALGKHPVRYFFWALIAVLLWTPLIVLGTSSSLVAGAVVLTGVHLLRRVRWTRVRARFDRWRRWEFWPAVVLYLPVAAHVARLAIKYGGLGTLSAANPAIPEGGFVGESKADILAQLPSEWTLRAVLVPAGGTEARLDHVRRLSELDEFVFPVIMKPDAGQRGTGVRLIGSLDEARAYLLEQPGDVLVQQFHPGPYEAGIFYYRMPGEDCGRIFSLTDKRFPVVTGDGRSTLEDLIWGHPRYRLQARVFLERHATERVRILERGERFTLAVAGNHCQGTMFLDGRHLMTEALERRVDAIARSMPGFFIGRFDVRYSSVEAFTRGEDLAIVELNGVTSESTNIYDPSHSLLHAWRVLCRQWTLIFEIGAANRARGHRSTSSRRLLTLSFRHVFNAPVAVRSS